jgi:crotonobetainyl-CoA:carnitine CoA-transferase CaiB-like acyl-CoA transferase
LGVAEDDLLAPARQNDRAVWAEAKKRMAAVFATRTRAEWEAVFEGSDACFSPVLSPTEVTTHPHTVARGVTVNVNGVTQAQSAPRFSRTVAGAGVPCHPGENTVDEILAGWN